MALIAGAATVPASTTGTFLFQVPPGQCQVTFYNAGTPAIYIGPGTVTSNTVTSLGGSNPAGFLLPTTHMAVTTFPTSKGNAVYGATAGTASTYATSLNYMISTSA